MACSRSVKDDLLLDRDQLGRCLQGHDLAVIGIGKGDPIRVVLRGRRQQAAHQAKGRPKDPRQGVGARPNAKVEIGPAAIHIGVQKVKEGVAGRIAGLFDKGARRRPA